MFGHIIRRVQHEPGEMIDASVFQTGEARIMRLEMRACPQDGAG